MIQVSNVTDLADFKYLSLVDTSTPEASVELPADLKLLTVVDHHKQAEPDAAFCDIRTHMGASCSIYAEYMREGLAPMTEQNNETTRCATAMLFGIQTDTDDFSLATAKDFEAAAYVKPYSDSEVLKRVGRRTISASGMDLLGRALHELTVVRDFAVAGVGAVSTADP